MDFVIDISFLKENVRCFVPHYTGHIQKNGAVLKVNTIDTAPFFRVYLYIERHKKCIKIAQYNGYIPFRKSYIKT
jgi:hypothetical protein